MKKLLFAVAAVMLLASCSNSPVKKFITLVDKTVVLEGKMAAIETQVDQLDNLDKDSSALKKQYLKLGAELDKLEKEGTELIDRNKDYQLTDSDRKVLKKWPYLKKECGSDNLFDVIDECKTLRDVMYYL